MPDPTRDAFHLWLEQHPEEEARYAGVQVAFHVSRGIVAAALTLEELLDQLDENQDGLSLDVVPAHGKET